MSSIKLTTASALKTAYMLFPGVADAVPEAVLDLMSRRALLLAVTTQESKYAKVALDMLAVQTWLFTVPPLLSDVKK